ncbi:MAG: D-glycero-beta-D-manno-heptose 1-phosphate adenylyltransferase [bacterium]|nr:D-glycero-beta-D-manno-heptose 1-phosphate adenylyltransferase [bacterium]MDD5354191.1 D-glycero-beta-D-manno-heptose 1-phosphate adenylyltransferase [bacterium]MDD5756327.1 D-glycero-beta-D-manno-heptose 1-phosphate adenylyltransferase [bacterium]
MKKIIRAKDKIVERKKLTKILAKLRSKGQKIVFTNGCFDLLHVGHVRYLNKAKQCGDILVVALNTDASVRRLKGKNRPLMPQRERAEVIGGLAAVDYVTFFPEETPEAIISELKPQVLVKGADYKIKDIVGNRFMKDNNGRVVRIPLAKGQSTSNIIKSIVQKYG